MYEKVKSAIESECPEVTVLENEEHPSIKLILGQKVERMPHPQLKFPKTGSFEVYFQGKLIYSKLKTGMWPNQMMVANTIRDIIDKVIEPKDFNSSSTKTLLKKPEVPKFSKIRSEAVLSQTKREQVPQTSHETKRNKGFSSTEQLKGFSKERKEEKKVGRDETSPENSKVQKYQENEAKKNESPKMTVSYKEAEPLRKNNSLKAFEPQESSKVERKDSIKKQDGMNYPSVPVSDSTNHPSHSTNVPMPAIHSEPNHQVEPNPSSNASKSNIVSPPVVFPTESKSPDSSKEPGPISKQPTLPTMLPPTMPPAVPAKDPAPISKQPTLPVGDENHHNQTPKKEIPAGESNPYKPESKPTEKTEEVKSSSSSSSSSSSKKSKKESSDDEEFLTSVPITESYKVTLPINEGKHSKITLKNSDSSTKVYKISVRNKKLLKVDQETYEVSPDIPQKLKLEILGQSSTGFYKGNILVSCEDKVVSRYEIVLEVQ